jgi:hypothetical protein
VKEDERDQARGQHSSGQSAGSRKFAAERSGVAICWADCVDCGPSRQR